MQYFLALRAVFFVIVFPGTVIAVVPIRILHATHRLRFPDFSVSAVVALALIVIGGAVLLTCTWHFLAAGGGTLAPVDPPRHLVVTGLYRFTRNPMYYGVLIILLSEAWLFQSVALLMYAGAVFIAVHLFVVLYEERTLQSRFGESYLAYRTAVPRWGFTVRPFTERRNPA